MLVDHPVTVTFGNSTGFVHSLTIRYRGYYSYTRHLTVRRWRPAHPYHATLTYIFITITNEVGNPQAARALHNDQKKTLVVEMWTKHHIILGTNNTERNGRTDNVLILCGLF